MNRSLCKSLCTLALVAAVISAVARTQETGGGNAGTGTITSTSKTKAAEKKTTTTNKAAAATPSSPEIAAAQSSGKVWVNTESGIYHKSGRWYGKTKQGKFMTESEAKAAGYKEEKKKETGR
jgi:hypothetical protein